MKISLLILLLTTVTTINTLAQTNYHHSNNDSGSGVFWLLIFVLVAISWPFISKLLDQDINPNTKNKTK